MQQQEEQDEHEAQQEAQQQAQQEAQQEAQQSRRSSSSSRRERTQVRTSFRSIPPAPSALPTCSRKSHVSPNAVSHSAGDSTDLTTAKPFSAR